MFTGHEQTRKVGFATPFVTVRNEMGLSAGTAGWTRTTDLLIHSLTAANLLCFPIFPSVSKMPLVGSQISVSCFPEFPAN